MKKTAPFGFLLLLAACTEYDILPEEQEVLDPEAPVATCHVTPTQVRPIEESATFDGSESFDPNGLELTFEWTFLSKPQGSAVDMPPGEAIRANFSPDLAGEYVAQLVVTNSDGGSSACEATLLAVPDQDLWVEMSWATPGDDMDLHLLAPQGQPETDQDCYYVNCTDFWTGYGSGLDWGAIGNPADDPILDLDDIPGTGPENINIGDPAEGTYTVVVHDYPGSVYELGNDVTVRIYLGGVEVYAETRTVTGEDSMTYFAKIDWTPTSAQVIPLQ